MLVQISNIDNLVYFASARESEEIYWPSKEKLLNYQFEKKKNESSR